jgi:hypothetical protein
LLEKRNLMPFGKQCQCRSKAANAAACNQYFHCRPFARECAFAFTRRATRAHHKGSGQSGKGGMLPPPALLRQIKAKGFKDARL